MHSLPLFLTIAGRPVILLGSGEAADAKRRLVMRAGGRPVGEDDPAAAEARIAFIALDDEAAAVAAAARLKGRGLLVNVVDRARLCDFTTPAIVDRDPVLIAIGSGGASAGLAAALRQRLEAWLPARLGALARALAEARTAIRARWPEGGARRRALGAALAPGGMLDPLGSLHDVDEWLRSGGDAPAAAYCCIHLGSDDPDDLSLRDLRALGQADRIIHSARAPAPVLARARADAARLVLPADAAPPPAPGLTVRILAPGD